MTRPHYQLAAPGHLPQTFFEDEFDEALARQIYAANRNIGIDDAGDIYRVPPCLDGPDGCEGTVEYRTTPDRSDGKAFPRCEAHFDLRMASVQRNLELTSDAPPAWFDPSYAGERWEDG